MRDPRPAFRYAKLLPGLLVLLWPGDASARVWYVNASARESKSTDGTTWERAFPDVQQALDAAASGDEIWVAAGKYKPTRRREAYDPRSAMFNLSFGVALYGGFAGWEQDKAQRDPCANETILSGDILGNDGLPEPPPHPCCTDETDPPCEDQACLGSLCLIHATCCDRWWYGCATWAHSECADLCRPNQVDNVYNVLFVANAELPATIDGFTIEGGEATNTYAWEHSHGGGLFVDRSTVILATCVFQHNHANNGSAVYIERGNAVLSDILVRENGVPLQAPGDVVLAWSSVLNVMDSNFYHNSGAALGITQGEGVILRSRFIGNRFGSGLRNNGKCRIVDCVFAFNEGISGGGAVADHETEFINCRFHRNVATAQGAGLFVAGLFGTYVINCVFSGNHADGGYQSYPGATPRIGYGGAISQFVGHLYILDSVIVGNTADDAGGASLSSATILNSIFWGNSDEESLGQSAQIAHGPGEPDIDYCCVQDWDGRWGLAQGIRKVDPRFVDPEGADGVLGTEDDDFRLRPDSPMINVGHPAPPLVPRYDADGHARILCGRVDIGAYEFGIGDYNCDGVVELIDFQGWKACATGPTGDTLSDDCRAFDFDADTDVDLWDFAGWQQVLPAE